LKRKTGSALILGFILLLTGCAAKPYSAARLTQYLEQKYEAEGRFALKETLEEGQYLFHDNERDVDFIVLSSVSGWGDNAILPLPHRSWDESLNSGIMFALREQALALAKNHGLTLVPVKDMLAGHAGRIYLSRFEQIDGAAALFCELRALYRLEQPDTLAVAVYYCEDAENLSGGIFENTLQLGMLRFINWTKEKGYYENGRDEIARALKDAWQSYANKGLLAAPANGEHTSP
jgi:hypothetical protein